MIVDLSLTFLITVQTGTFCRTLSRTCTLICALAKFERLLPLGTFQQKNWCNLRECISKNLVPAY